MSKQHSEAVKYEVELANILYDHGFLVMRNERRRSSNNLHHFYDMLAFKNGTILPIEVKSKSKSTLNLTQVGRRNWNTLNKRCELAGTIPYLFFRLVVDNRDERILKWRVFKEPTRQGYKSPIFVWDEGMTLWEFISQIDLLVDLDHAPTEP